MFFVGMEDTYFKVDRFSTRKYLKVFVETIVVQIFENLNVLLLLF